MARGGLFPQNRRRVRVLCTGGWREVALALLVRRSCMRLCCRPHGVDRVVGRVVSSDVCLSVGCPPGAMTDVAREVRLAVVKPSLSLRVRRRARGEYWPILASAGHTMISNRNRVNFSVVVIRERLVRVGPQIGRRCDGKMTLRFVGR